MFPLVLLLLQVPSILFPTFRNLAPRHPEDRFHNSLSNSELRCSAAKKSVLCANRELTSVRGVQFNGPACGSDVHGQWRWHGDHQRNTAGRYEWISSHHDHSEQRHRCHTASHARGESASRLPQSAECEFLPGIIVFGTHQHKWFPRGNTEREWDVAQWCDVRQAHQRYGHVGGHPDDPGCLPVHDHCKRRRLAHRDPTLHAHGELEAVTS